MEDKPKMKEVKLKICDYLKAGMCKKDSAIMSGISEATFYRWIENDESFESHVEASILEYKHSLVRKVNMAAEKDGRLALEVLSRRFPNEWSNNAITERVNDEESIQQIAELLQNMYKERASRQLHE